MSEKNKSTDDATTAYARDVSDGRIIAGPLVRAACARHLRDLETGHERGLVWDVGEANRAIRFFRVVLTVEVEDEEGESYAAPFVLQPWQCFIVGCLFGWKNAHGFRRFRRAYVEIAKGNGKSPMAAGIGHYMLTATGKLRAEVYSAATDKDQAAILFRDAVAMWERSPALRSRLDPSGQNPVWQLTDLSKGAFFKPISSEKKGKSGIRPYCALIDEVHEHPDNSVIEMLRAGTKGNQQALIFEITNSGFDRKSVCWHEHEYSAKVVNGDIENDAWFTFIASLDEDDDPFDDESCWIKANPNLGVSIQLPYIREQVREARGMPSKEGLVRRLHFCQWTESEAAAFSREVVEPCFGQVDPDELTEKGFPCYGGLDLSRVNDLTAFTLTWVLDATPDQWRFASKTWFWLPADTLKDRARAERAPYDLWAEQGHLEAVPGKRLKYGWLAEAITRLCSRYHPTQIGADQYGLENLREHLDGEGISLPFVVHPQGFNTRKIGEAGRAFPGAEDVALWMPDAVNKFEAALIEQRITMDRNPVMAMCLYGAVFTANRTGHRMFNKEAATTHIDGAVSQAMSIGVATVTQPAPVDIMAMIA